jgi:preprotein translocase subunit YajC
MNHVLDFFPLLMGMPAGGSGESGGGSGQLVTTIITFGLVILIFYFLIIRPQSKKQKETKRMLADIKKGDKVVTIGGIRGTVQTVRDETVVVKVERVLFHPWWKELRTGKKKSRIPRTKTTRKKILNKRIRNDCF